MSIVDEQTTSLLKEVSKVLKAQGKSTLGFPIDSQGAFGKVVGLWIITDGDDIWYEQRFPRPKGFKTIVLKPDEIKGLHKLRVNILLTSLRRWEKYGKQTQDLGYGTKKKEV